MRKNPIALYSVDYLSLDLEFFDIQSRMFPVVLKLIQICRQLKMNRESTRLLKNKLQSLYPDVENQAKCTMVVEHNSKLAFLSMYISKIFSGSSL